LRNGAGRSADAGGMFATITLPSRHSRAGGPQRPWKEHSWEYRQAAVAGAHCRPVSRPAHRGRTKRM